MNAHFTQKSLYIHTNSFQDQSMLQSDNTWWQKGAGKFHLSSWSHCLPAGLKSRELPSCARHQKGCPETATGPQWATLERLLQIQAGEQSIKTNSEILSQEEKKWYFLTETSRSYMGKTCNMANGLKQETIFALTTRYLNHSGANAFLSACRRILLLAL